MEPKKPLSELDLAEPEQQAQAREEIKLLQPERLVYTSKPIAIVVNPSSGKKSDLRPLIQARLEQGGIPFEFHLSTKYFMTWEIAETIDLDKYSALVAVGGDGTYHEVVNGMLHRSDKKRIPIGFIPNGSGNDTLRSLWVTDPAKALDYIVKGDLLKVDITRVMFDFDTEDELEKMSREDKIRKLRYQLINSSYGIPAKLNFGAQKFKGRCCCNPYQVSALIEFCRIRYEEVDIIVDGETLFSGLPTGFVMGATGKHGGNDMLCCPVSVINDGLMELIIITKKEGFGGMARIMD